MTHRATPLAALALVAAAAEPAAAQPPEQAAPEQAAPDPAAPAQTEPPPPPPPALPPMMSSAPSQVEPLPPPLPPVMSRRWAVSAGIGWESFTAKTDGGDKITFGTLELAGRFRIRRNVEVALSVVGGGAQDDIATAGLYVDMRYRFMAEKAWNVYGSIGLGVASVAGKPADDDEKKGRGSLRLGFGVERRFTSLAVFGEARPVWVAENKDIPNLSDQPDWYQFSKFPLGGGHVLFGATFYF
jgi:hypothetical protein